MKFIQLFFRWLTTQHPEKRIRYNVQLMLFCQGKGQKRLRKYFQRKIYYNHSCDISCTSKIDKSVTFHHPLGIIIGDKAVISENVRIYQQVTIGSKMVGNEMPVIKENVKIYAGAKLLGGITIGAGSIIGANSTITKSVPERHLAVGYNRIIPLDEELTVQAVSNNEVVLNNKATDAALLL
ncbi:serine O-acetyltransferase [Vibrio gazogenes]|uniref:Serine acetyltransferase n=1 Tax=Vibrio gazogenes TaxID=687 RepID=A0A1Z2SCH7_VIBGA|nr:serine acetyltransferase [Vibrio gazogenes]ASA54855.1 hypothetical protein BSQ33_03345 [Vibrio gazogenes]